MRRKFWLMRHPVQMRFVMAVILSMVLPSIIISGCLYFLIFSLLAEELALPEGVFEVLLPVFSRINVILVIFLPLVFAAIVLVALKLSNRFAGPIERLECDLDEILSGNREKRLAVRSKDDLVGVIERVNRILNRETGGAS